MNKTITLNLPDEWVNAIDTIAGHTKKTRSQLIRAIIKSQLKLPDVKVAMGRPVKEVRHDN